jgi:phosphoribosylformimino-5-aminoimidazole carboxamide ribotide isomerase
LHLVDLDGATKGEPQHADIASEIARVIHVPIQMGGGIRQLEVAEQLLKRGIQRIILGTAAVEDSKLIMEACRRFGEDVIISIDVKDGYVATHGWQERSKITSVELIEKMAALGAKRFIYTDIACDGTLTQPNFEGIAELVTHTDLPIIASGGISSIAHLHQLSQLGIEGAIVGRALYTGDVDLREALNLLAEKGGHNVEI